MESFLDGQVKFYNLYLDLADAGVDWLAETTKACRRRQISPWVSVRMNDTHGIENQESHFNAAIFKKKEMRLSGVDPDPQIAHHSKWMALNYVKPEVREFMMSHIHEYLNDYDFEGIELDWLETLIVWNRMLLSSSAMRSLTGLRDTVTDESEGENQRQAFPHGMRIPGNLGYLKSRGLDVKTIVRRGLVDFLGFSNFWQTSWDMPYDELRRQLGSDVVFYGVVEDAPNWISGYSPELAKRKVDPAAAPHPNGGLRYMAASPEMQRANAAGKLVMGVHGIEQFNFFCADQPKIPGVRADYTVLRGTHDLEFLRGKPKHYCLSTPSTWLSTLWELPEQLPVILEPKARREFRLSMCSEPVGTKAVVQVVTEKGALTPRLGVSVNGRWATYESQPGQALLFPVGSFTEHMPGTIAWNFPVDASEIRDGWNRFLVLNTAQSSTCKIVSIEIGLFS
ncbi:MAG: hypothetical protein WKF37_23180 [Bryobacteraceae bacterium]